MTPEVSTGQFKNFPFLSNYQPPLQNILFFISETSVSGGQDDIMIDISVLCATSMQGLFFLEDKHVHEDKDGNQTSAYICWSPLLFVKVTTHWYISVFVFVPFQFHNHIIIISELLLGPSCLGLNCLSPSFLIIKLCLYLRINSFEFELHLFQKDFDIPQKVYLFLLQRKHFIHLFHLQNMPTI